MQYIEIAEAVLRKSKQKYELIEQPYFVDDNGIIYNVDNKHVILKPTEREKEVAKILGELYGGTIKIIPRVNEPEKIKTPDYIIENQRFDLKQITGTGKYVIVGNLKGKQKQANNFIIDITKSKITEKGALNQINTIYQSKRYSWIKIILLIKEKKSIKIFHRR